MDVQNTLSLVIAVCTAFYTIINLMIWFESRATRKQKITPHIVLFLKWAENHIQLELHIKNIGEGLAKNVKIKTLKDYSQYGKKHLLLSDIGIMKNGFNSFPPQYELKYYIDSMSKLHETDKDGSVMFEVSYDSSDKRHFKEIFELNFNQLFGQNYSEPPETYMGQIPYYLEKISSTINKMGQRGNSKI